MRVTVNRFNNKELLYRTINYSRARALLTNYCTALKHN